MKTNLTEKLWLVSPIAMYAIGAAIYFAGYRTWESVACKELRDVSGMPTTFRVMSGCYVRVNGRMVPRDSWRGEEGR